MIAIVRPDQGQARPHRRTGPPAADPSPPRVKSGRAGPATPLAPLRLSGYAGGVAPLETGAAAPAAGVAALPGGPGAHVGRECAHAARPTAVAKSRSPRIYAMSARAAPRRSDRSGSLACDGVTADADPGSKPARRSRRIRVARVRLRETRHTSSSEIASAAAFAVPNRGPRMSGSGPLAGALSQYICGVVKQPQVRA
jgi:hypothetical protein